MFQGRGLHYRVYIKKNAVLNNLSYFIPIMIRRRILQKKLRLYVSGQRASLQSIYIEECCVKQLILFYSDNDS